MTNHFPCNSMLTLMLVGVMLLTQAHAEPERDPTELERALFEEKVSGAERKHARILSFSLDSVKRNFTLCQVNDELVLRLRTTKTGENGTSPQVTLGKIEGGKVHRIALTYQRGALSFHIDGEAKPPQQIDGDFSNWEEYQLVLGNEWKDERPWNGRIRKFAIHASVLNPERAKQWTNATK